MLIATNQVLRSDKKPSVNVDSTKSEIARASCFMMAGIMASSCCVCRCQLSEVIGKGRHKRLRCCSKEKMVWEQFANQRNCFAAFQLAFAEDCAVFCYSCIEEAKKLDKFKCQLIGLKKEMADVLGCVPNDLDNVAEPTTEQTQGDHISATHKRINRPKRSKGATEPAKKPRVSVRYCLCNAF